VLRAAGRNGNAGDDVQLADIQPVGAYGVRFVFSNGHDRGIFPWVFLRELLEKPLVSGRGPCDTNRSNDHNRSG